MADIFDEISGDLRAERAIALLKRYAPLVIVAVLLAGASVAGWQLWRSRGQQQAGQVSATFADAVGRSTVLPAADGTDTSREAAAKAFDDLAATAPPGYRTLARMRGAALHAAMNDLPGALLRWDQVAADTDADPLFRSLANLMWVEHQTDSGDPAAIQARLIPLLAPGSAWRPLAMESRALVLLRTGKRDAGPASRSAS